jgi:hypothetical protein
VETKKGATLGTLLPSGAVHRTAEEQRIQRDLAALADRQVVDKIHRIKRDLDAVVPPIIKVMERASMTAKALQERVFDRYSCLWRVTAGLSRDAATALRANYAAILERAEPMELVKLAQRAIDEASPQSLLLVDCLLRENLGRSRDERRFQNAELLQLAVIPEADEAAPLLEEVVSLHKHALDTWAAFANSSFRMSTLRVRNGLATLTGQAK